MAEPAADHGLRDLYTIVGFVVVNWALTEQALDGAIAVLFDTPESRALVRKIPAHFERKIGFLRNATCHLTAWQKFQTDAEALAVRLEKFAALRHRLVHDAVRSAEMRDGKIEFATLRPEGDVHRLTVWEFDGFDFPAIAKDVTELCSDVTAFTFRLIAHHEQADQTQ